MVVEFLFQADKLRALRIGKALTLQELAELSGTAKSTLSELENSVITQPSADVVFRLADALKVSANDLMKPIMTADRKRLLQIIDKESLITSDAGITLRTGSRSSFYFDCKASTLNGEGLLLLADAMIEEIDRFPGQPSAIGGLTMGADFIVAAVIMRAAQIGHSIVAGSIVRKEPKKHGTRNYIENALDVGTKIVVVDDVVTTGTSTELACTKFIEAGYDIVGIVALIDREAGGMDALREKFNCPVQSVFQKSDFSRLTEKVHDNDS